MESSEIAVHVFTSISVHDPLPPDPVMGYVLKKNIKRELPTHLPHCKGGCKLIDVKT